MDSIAHDKEGPSYASLAKQRVANRSSRLNYSHVSYVEQDTSITHSQPIDLLELGNIVGCGSQTEALGWKGFCHSPDFAGYIFEPTYPRRSYNPI